MQAFKDREAEQMHTEICSKLGTHPGGDKEGRLAGTSRFVALAELHATSGGQKSAARRAARFYFFTLQDSGVEWRSRARPWLGALHRASHATAGAHTADTHAARR